VCVRAVSLGVWGAGWVHPDYLYLMQTMLRSNPQVSIRSAPLDTGCIWHPSGPWALIGAWVDPGSPLQRLGAVASGLLRELRGRNLEAFPIPLTLLPTDVRGTGCCNFRPRHGHPLTLSLWVLRGLQEPSTSPLMMSQMEGGWPLDLNTVTDLFLQRNMIREATSFLLDVLKPNLPEHAMLQTKVSKQCGGQERRQQVAGVSL